MSEQMRFSYSKEKRDRDYNLGTVISGPFPVVLCQPWAGVATNLEKEFKKERTLLKITVLLLIQARSI
jgi:hypothetical protein